MGTDVQLRPVAEADLDQLLRFFTEEGVAGEFQWFGYRLQRVADLRRRWEEDGLIGGEQSFLAVTVEDEVCAGWVSWRPAGPHGNWEIGAALFPQYRGRGIGTEVQRRLVRYLFDVTTAQRIEAGTEVGNVGEQRALEKAGFKREGVQRAAYFRAGQWRDSVMYGLTRDDIA